MNTITRREARVILAIFISLALLHFAKSSGDLSRWETALGMILSGVVGAVTAFVLIPPHPRY